MDEKQVAKLYLLFQFIGQRLIQDSTKIKSISWKKEEKRWNNGVSAYLGGKMNSINVLTFVTIIYLPLTMMLLRTTGQSLFQGVGVILLVLDIVLVFIVLLLQRTSRLIKKTTSEYIKMMNEQESVTVIEGDILKSTGISTETLWNLNEIKMFVDTNIGFIVAFNNTTVAYFGANSDGKLDDIREEMIRYTNKDSYVRLQLDKKRLK